MPDAPAVLCYHRIGGPFELGVTRASRQTFRKQMQALARDGWRSLSLSAFAASLRTTHRAEKSLLLTFDDGYASLAEYAYPLLAELGFTATTFLITDFIGKTNTWDVPYAFRRLPHLDWRTIETWRGRGFEFQSHTATHARLTWLDEAAAADELARSRETLVRRLGPEAGRAIAYPFGAADARVERLASAAGYELGFGGWPRGVSALRLARTPVYMWDALRVPLGLQPGLLGAAGRSAAALANRCAVGTSVMLRLARGVLGLPSQAVPQRRGQEHGAD